MRQRERKTNCVREREMIEPFAVSELFTIKKSPMEIDDPFSQFDPTSTSMEAACGRC